MGTYETDVTTFRALLAGLPIVSESGAHAHRGMVALTVGEHGMRARSTDLLDTWANAHVGSIEAGNVGYFRLSALKAAIKGSKGALKVTLDSTGTLRLGIVQLQSLDGSDYSDALNIPADSDSAPSVTVETTDLAWVAKAASKDTYPANLSGIMFRNGQACATDRFRLHVVETCGDTIETLIPVKAMRPLLTSGARILRVSADDNGSRMSAYEGKRGVSRVWRFRRAIDSQFPQWDRLFPDTYSTRILIGLSDLGPALAQSVGVDVGNRVTLDMAGRTLTAESETSSVKAAIDSVTVTDGLALTVGFNAAYMTDLLDGSQLAALGFNGDRKPIVLHDMGGKRGLVMPIHK